MTDIGGWNSPFGSAQLASVVFTGPYKVRDASVTREVVLTNKTPVGAYRGYGQPEVNLGIIPGYGGTQRLTHLIGRGKANELMMTGDMIGAEEARQLGLVNHVLPTKAEALGKAEEIIAKIMSKAPLAIGMIVDCVNAAFLPDENGYQTEANSFARCVKSGDYKEGTTAFLEKRKPIFKGE